MNLAVVGHTEWVRFVRVERLPRPGEIVHATDTWVEVGGGGAIVAVLIARLAGRCTLLTAAAGDGVAEALEAEGVEVHRAERPRTRRLFAHVDDRGERTLTVYEQRVVPERADPLPWEALAEADGAFFAAGDAGAARAARAARVLVATPRAADALQDVELDALVYSGDDEAEMAWAARLPAPRLRVETLGPDGGRWEAADGSAGTWAAMPPPGDVVDTFGCGDAFVAALTLGLASGRPLADILHHAARCGAAVLGGRGPYGTPLPAP